MNPRLVLLPGLGADGRLFAPQRDVFPDLISLSWPEARPGETLTSYAARVASSIPRDGPLILGGSSFGGMVALEMSALLRPERIILIGSCTSPGSLAPWIGALRGPARIVPSGLLRPRRWALPLAPLVPGLGRLSPERRRLAWDMAMATSGPFLKWGVEAVLAWRPSPTREPVSHIHGTHDPLIPIERTRPTRVVEGGGHLLTLSHPGQVNAFLMEILSDARAF